MLRVGHCGELRAPRRRIYICIFLRAFQFTNSHLARLSSEVSTAKSFARFYLSKRTVHVVSQDIIKWRKIRPKFNTTAWYFMQEGNSTSSFSRGTALDFLVSPTRATFKGHSVTIFTASGNLIIETKLR